MLQTVCDFKYQLFPEMEHNISPVLQPGGRAPVRVNRRRPHQGVHQLDALHGTGGPRQETSADGIRQRLQHARWDW